MTRGTTRWFARLLAAALAMSAPAVPGVAQEGGDPPSAAVPNYWDPAHRRQKPVLTGRGMIRFLTEADSPPFSFVGADGLPTGFHVELARAICVELSVNCTIQKLRWDILVDGIDRGYGEAIVSSMAVTPATVERFDFTGRYMMRPARFVVRRDGAAFDATPAGLDRRAVAVVGDTAHQAYLEAFFPGAVARSFDDEAAARAALVEGEVDALFGDGLNLSLWLNAAASQRCCAFRGGPYTESRFFGEGFAIAVERGDEELRGALDFALARLQQSGVFAEIYRRYFPVSFY